jgi:hypothetical protein
VSEVGRTERAIQRVIGRKALGCGELLDRSHDLLAGGTFHSEHPEQLTLRDALPWQVGMQLKRAVGDPHVRAVFETVDGPPQPVVHQPAPGADDVRPEFDVHRAPYLWFVRSRILH